jgi:nickel-dependent lactate racemase
MEISLPYGDTMLGAPLDWARVIATLDVAGVPPLPDVAGAMRDALEHPRGMPASFLDGFQGGERVAIIVSDSFRQTRVNELLPVLLDQLAAANIADVDISFCFATGVHRAPTVDEQRRILGDEVHARFAPNCHCHDAFDDANLVLIGTTSRGTPVRINRRVAECDRIIVTGTVVFHYFGGFGGGRKSVLPGIAAAGTIAHNHAMNLHPVNDQLDPNVRIGALDGNPVAEDMLEGARLALVHGIVNTVLNRRGEIAGLFAGELDTAHRAACEFARGLFAVPIETRADLVIASAGGAKNFVQSHKALYNAWQAVKPGGRIIFLAKCEEGLGAEKFAQWVRLRRPAAIIAQLRKNSEINGQTALSTVQKAPSAIFVTDMAEPEVALLGARKASSLEEALQRVRADLAQLASPTCYLMPSASYSVPFPPD